MIVDTSAIMAILYGEPEEVSFLTILVNAPICRMSAATYVETCVVADARNKSSDLDRLLHKLSVRIEPFTEEQARIARQAYRDYGRGNHPAALNYGDCFAYALAKDMREPLLFKGTDFAATDVRVAV